VEEIVEMRDTNETFLVDSDLTRDAVYAGIWNRLCCEIRAANEEEQQLHKYIEHHAVGRDDPAPQFEHLDEGLGWLAVARGQLRAVERTPLGSTVELDDVERFMPIAWKENGPSGPGRWIYTESETEEADLLAPERVVRVRRRTGGDA
jgi:hypothetical protein